MQQHRTSQVRVSDLNPKWAVAPCLPRPSGRRMMFSRCRAIFHPRTPALEARCGQSLSGQTCQVPWACFTPQAMHMPLLRAEGRNQCLQKVGGERADVGNVRCDGEQMFSGLDNFLAASITFRLPTLILCIKHALNLPFPKRHIEHDSQ